MQKSFIAIALALTLTCAFAAYNTNNASYVKPPVPVANDNETSYTNANYLTLISSTTGELDLLGTNQTASTVTTSNWNAIYKKLDGKTLAAATTNTTAALSGAPGGEKKAMYINGYAITFGNEKDNNGFPQISVYQNALTGGATASKIYASSNNNTNFTPNYLYCTVISKTAYVFYEAVSTTANTTGANVTFQVNVSNFALGGAKAASEFILTSAYSSNLSVVWGEALGSNQLYANWIEGGVPKYSAIDVSKGTANGTIAIGWNSSFTCTAFSTDKKWFGDLCFYTNSAALTTSYYVRFNSTNFYPLVTNATNYTTWTNVYPYGPYIAITYSDTATSVGRSTLSYDIWNLDTLAPFRNKTAFVTYDASNSSVTTFRVPSGGLFTLLSNAQANVSGVVYNNSGLQVGLVLGSSYLTSVLGFILTIVAGLLLF